MGANQRASPLVDKEIMMISSEIVEVTTTEKEIQILHLEDDAKDAELIQATLDSAEIPAHITCVQSASEFTNALSEEQYELILADYHLPAYDGMSALQYSRENYPDIPFIFVSGMMGEDAAIDGLTQGATDYVLKNKLTRLVPAIQRALSEVENRKKRRESEEALRGTSILLERIFSTTEFMLAYLDTEFNFIRVNRAYAEISEGKSPENFEGKNLFELNPDSEHEAIFRRVVDTGKPYVAYAKPFATGHLEQDATYWNWSLHPVKDENGRVTGLVLSSIDVTEREQAYITLREREEQLRLQGAALEAAANGFIITDRDGKILWANSSFTHLTGYSMEEVIGRKPNILKSGKQEQDFYKNLWDTILSGRVWHGELVNQHKDGHEYSEEMTIAPLHSERGEISHFIAVKQDVTERKQAEIALYESEARYHSFVEQATEGIVLYTLETKQLLEANPAYQKLLGYTADEMRALTLYDIVGHDRASIDRFVEQIRNEKRVWIGERKHRHKDGSLVSVEVSSNLISVGGEQVMAVVVRDITERKKAEQALQEGEERLRQIASSLREVIWLRDVQTRQVLYVNPAFEELTGWACESFYENRDIVMDIIYPDDKEEVIKALEQRFEDVPYDKEHRIIRLDGSVRWVSSRIFPVRNEVGEVYRWASIMEDITERKQHEREREAVITVSTALRQARSRTEILNVILDQLVDLFDADGAILVLPAPKTGGLTNEMGRGTVGERLAGLNIPLGEGVGNWVITNKKPYLNNHADQDPLFYRPDLLGDSPCLMAVPLIAQAQAIGALLVTRQVNFVEQDLRLLTAIADIAASAIHRVTLHEQTEQQLHRLTALHQIDLAISTNLDLNITLNVILRNVRDELEVDAASILLLNPVTHTLDYVAGSGFRTQNIEQSHVRIGNGCAGRAVQEHRTISCENIVENGRVFVRSSLLADEEFVSHYTTPLVVKGQAKGVLEIFHRTTLESEDTWLGYFETLATQAAIAIENTSLFENLQRSNTDLTLAYDATIEGWSRAMELRDRETEGHTQRVAEITLKLGEKMGMSNVEKMDLRRGALLHDIGKMGIPDSILLKPGPLSNEEWKIMRQHPLYAYQMLSPIKYLKHALEIPYCHHEKWDGSGYPRGLKGDEIPLSARVFSVVDVFDALTSDRPYSSAWEYRKAYRYIQEQSGKHFDPQIVKIFLETKYLF